jgi:hypothetical protein
VTFSRIIAITLLAFAAGAAPGSARPVDLIRTSGVPVGTATGGPAPDRYLHQVSSPSAVTAAPDNHLHQTGSPSAMVEPASPGAGVAGGLTASNGRGGFGKADLAVLSAPEPTSSSGGFHWDDAGIGAGVLGALLLALGGAYVVVHRTRRSPAAG